MHKPLNSTDTDINMLIERCEIHSNKMYDEGWYVTADVLSQAAEVLNEIIKLRALLKKQMY